MHSSSVLLSRFDEIYASAAMRPLSDKLVWHVVLLRVMPAV